MMCPASRFLLVAWVAGLAGATLTGSDTLGWAAAAVAVVLAYGLARRSPDRFGGESCSLPPPPRECDELGIKLAWMHRAFGAGSVCDEATVYGREHGMTVIDGGCPLMFDPTADVGHKVMRFVLTRTGKVPKKL